VALALVGAALLVVSLVDQRLESLKVSATSVELHFRAAITVVTIAHWKTSFP